MLKICLRLGRTPLGLCLCIAFMCVAPLRLFAKPVSVDEIFTKRSQFKILGSFSYVNIHNASVGIVQVQQPNGSFINVPTAYKANQDYLNFSLQARYGIAPRVEIFSTLNSFWQQSRFEGNGSFGTQQNGDFGSFALGFIIEAKKEGKAPALLIGGSGDVVERVQFRAPNASLSANPQGFWQYGKGYSLFATSFYTIDPLVFLLQANARINLVRDLDSTQLHQGDIYSLSPMVFFAINPFVSLSFGVRYQYSTRAYNNDELISLGGSSVGYVFGAAYEIKSRLILFGNAESFKSAQYSSDNITLMLSYRI